MAKKKGFLEHLDNLESIAEQLRNSSRVDLDKLIPMVDSAMDSYKECLSRIEAVESLLASRQIPTDDRQAEFSEPSETLNSDLNK